MSDPGTPDAPFLGETVIYVSRNGDGIESPAIVLRTQATTNLEVLANWPEAPSLTVHYLEDALGTLSGKWRPAELVPQLETPFHVDLLVHGLGGDHRQFNVPFFQPMAVAGGSPDWVPEGYNAHTWHWLDS